MSPDRHSLPDTQTAIRILHAMERIRAVEETIAARYGEQQMRCPTHLSVGQEAPAAALGECLRPDDLAVSTHRAHAHYLAKGGDLPRMLAELHGRATGCSGGRGGSMHLIDTHVGFMGSTAIVGNSIPVGTGLALAQQLDGDSDAISVVFIGDGAIEEGVFYESANFAAVRGLPLLFVCENNGYSVYSGMAPRQPAGRRIAELVAAIGIPTRTSSDRDVAKLHADIATCVNAVRGNRVPHLIEIDTYRWREHCGPNFDNDIGYRSEQEFLQREALDPLRHYRQRLLDEGLIDGSDFERLSATLSAEIDQAFESALAAPWPDAESIDSFHFSNAELIAEELLPWRD